MAKLTDKFFNRIIEGPLKLQSEDEKQVKDLAKEVIEAGQTENAKPLYYHAIECYQYSSETLLLYQLTFVIIDNSPTLYTWTRFKSWLLSIPTAVLVNANGFYNYNSEGIVNMAGLFHPEESQTIYITGNDKDCTYISISKSFTDLDAIIGAGEFFDRCNKLN